MIEVRDLVKWYGPTLAVDRLNFSIEAGQIVGFLGPNGAGKSTTLRMLTGFLPPTSGAAAVAGHDVISKSLDVRKSIGYLPESTPVYLDMRVDEFLHFRGRLFGMSRKDRQARIDIVCDRCGLAKVRRRVIGHLSKGNRQRVGLAQALLHDPPVLILDEPTAGLDPNQIGEVRKLIQELGEQHTILLSTHILPEVEKAADRVIIIAGGRIVAEGTPDELRKNVAGVGGIAVEVKAAAKAVNAALGSVTDVKEVQTTMTDDWCRAVVMPRDGMDLRESIGQTIRKNNWQIRELRHEAGSLEEFFVQITARQDQAVQNNNAA